MNNSGSEPNSPEMSAERGIAEYKEDEEYQVGWPIERSWKRSGPLLKDLVTSSYKTEALGHSVWKSLCGAMTGGKPVEHAKEPYFELAQSLTRWFVERSPGGGT